MPVQINEMIIRANIQEPHEQKAAVQKSGDSSSASKEEIIKECTEIILEILRNKNEK